jgi:hypothetical protein
MKAYDNILAKFNIKPLEELFAYHRTRINHTILITRIQAKQILLAVASDGKIMNIKKLAQVLGTRL